MKKLVILAIFASVLATFAEVRYNAAGHKITKYNDEAEPDCYHTTEYFQVKIRWQGAVMKEGKLVHENNTARGLLRLRTDNGEQTASWLYNVGGDIVAERAAFQSLVAVDLADGTKKGYFAVDYKIGGRGNGIVDASVRLCGELKLTWNESRKHWESMSGDGYAVGVSDGGRVPDLIENASWASPSKAVLPIRGVVTISPYGYLTNAQQLRMAPTK